MEKKSQFRPRGGGTNRTALLLTFICCAGFSLGPALYIRDKYLRPETALTTKSEKAFSPQVAVRGAYTNVGSKDIGRDTTDYTRKKR